MFVYKYSILKLFDILSYYFLSFPQNLSKPKYPIDFKIVSIPPTANPNFQLPLINQPEKIVIEVAITLHTRVFTIVCL